jgi:CTP synthase
VRQLYGEPTITERHRHRYEVNNMLLKPIENAGLRIAGRSGDDQLVEIIEVPNHPWFVACQFHPEFTSTPRDGHPLFAGFVKAAASTRSVRRSKRVRTAMHPSGCIVCLEF